MGNLTTQQLTAIIAGQPFRQVFSIKAPVIADHTAYTTTVIDDGIWPTATAPARRVLNAGTRKHAVWNPHPKSTERPRVVKYAIEVDNSDGLFDQRSGSVWNPFGIYDADPAECFLLHSIYVWDDAAKSWSPIPHMDFVGLVANVDYEDGATMNRTETGPGVSVPTAARNVATITSEQVGAWSVLRKVFSKADGIDEAVDGLPLGLGQFTPL